VTTATCSTNTWVASRTSTRRIRAMHRAYKAV
jgi:hypothetical protein